MFEIFVVLFTKFVNCHLLSFVASLIIKPLKSIIKKRGEILLNRYGKIKC